MSHALNTSCYTPMCICHCFSLTRICTLIQCNVHVFSPSITVALIAGFFQNKPGLLTPTLTSSVWHYDNLCNKVQVAAQSIIMTLQRARHHVIISCSFQTEIFPLHSAPFSLLPPGGAVCHGLTQCLMHAVPICSLIRFFMH